MMDLRNSHTADVAKVQKSITSERLEGLKCSSMDRYAPTNSEDRLSVIEAFTLHKNWSFREINKHEIYLIASSLEKT